AQHEVRAALAEDRRRARAALALAYAAEPARGLERGEPSGELGRARAGDARAVAGDEDPLERGAAPRIRVGAGGARALVPAMRQAERLGDLDVGDDALVQQQQLGRLLASVEAH